MYVKIKIVKYFSMLIRQNFDILYFIVSPILLDIKTGFLFF